MSRRAITGMLRRAQRGGRWCIWVVSAWLVIGQVLAHRPSDGWLQLTVSNRSVTLQLDLALKDLEGVLELDPNNERDLTWAELRRREPGLNKYITRHLTLTNANERLTLVPEPLRLVSHEEVLCASLFFTAEAKQPLDQLTLTYRCLFDLDSQHRALVQTAWAGATVAGVGTPGATTALIAENFTGLLSPREPSVTFVGPASSSGGTASMPTGLLQFFQDGVHHIWTGYDHLLFLAALLLPAVLWRDVSGWRPRDGFWECVKTVLQVVTAFTVAHSMTLALAAFGLARPPSRFIESAIAASVLYAAASNLWSMGTVRPTGWKRRVAVPFAFGLIHGFGFANVLGELGLSGRALVGPLVGFNLGVEAGQLAAVGVFVPVAFACRKTRFYRAGVLPLGSSVIALIATAWLVDRLLNLQFMPF